MSDGIEYHALVSYVVFVPYAFRLSGGFPFSHTKRNKFLRLNYVNLFPDPNPTLFCKLNYNMPILSSCLYVEAELRQYFRLS